MGRKSLVLMSSEMPAESVVYVSKPIRVDQWYTDSTHFQTVSIAMSNFKGRVSIEASIKACPTDNDWFPVALDGRPHIDYPLTGVGSETSTKSFNFKGRFVWLRARVDKSYVIPVDSIQTIVAACGFVDRILVNI
jgi:hypothetical protein